MAKPVKGAAPMLTRRDTIKMGLTAVLVLAWLTIGISAFGQAPQSPTCRPFFCNALPIPPFAPKLDRVKDAAQIKSILDQAITEASGSHRITHELRAFLEKHADFYEITMERALKQILRSEEHTSELQSPCN